MLLVDIFQYFIAVVVSHSRQGNRIVEVNGVNMNNKNHVQVVERIKANLRAVDLLVVDPKCFAFYEDRGVVVRGTWDVVRVVANPLRTADVDVVAVAEVVAEPSPPAHHKVFIAVGFW